MLMVCHHLSRNIPEDVAFAESRIRAETIGAEDVFHDRGIISMMSSDSQAMGRIGEAIVRCWQTAHKMKVQLGALAGDSARNDNERVKRYVAKYTINPAITHGIGRARRQHRGRQAGRPRAVQARVLRREARAGPQGRPARLRPDGRPERQHRHAPAGLPAAAVRRLRPGPVEVVPDVRLEGRRSTTGSSSATASSARWSPSRTAASIGKKDMRRNEATPEIRVDADTYQVWVDGEKVGSEPLDDAADGPALLPVLSRRLAAVHRPCRAVDQGPRSEMTMNLRLLQIADSALPIGGYTHSWGLEAAIARGLVHDPESLEQWTGRWLRTCLGPLEGVLVAASCRAARGGRLGRPVRAQPPGRGLDPAPLDPRGQPGDGRADAGPGGDLGLVRAGAGTRDRSTVPLKSSPGTTRSSSDCSARSPSGDPQEVLTAYLHQAALGMIGAGVRAIPVGHTHGQQVLAYLHDDIRELAATLAGRDPETAGAGCPFYEVLCDEQTHLYARMFRS